MKKTSIQQLALTGLFAAMVCIATMIIKIPTPGTGGYVHLGDAFAILSGIFLGPVCGFLAAGIGSGLADVFGGYFLYAPVTFLIKGLVALASYFIYHKLVHKVRHASVKCIFCGLAATILVAGGYLIFELFVYGAGAIASVPANIGQGISGLIISSILLPLLLKAKLPTY